MSEEIVKGLRDLEKKLLKLGPSAGGKALRSAAMRSMLIAQNEAKARAPVNKEPGLHKTYKGRLVAPGFASRSVRRKSLLSRNKQFTRVMLGVRNEAYYALQFVERGTVHQAKRPWLEPAFRSTKSSVVRRFASILKTNIQKAAK